MTWTRALALVALAYLLGFAVFAVSLGRPVDGVATDAVVVPTGGPGRIARGLAVLRARQARRMLITGTDPQVRAIDLAREYRAPPPLFACCVDLGHAAVDTRSNADETAAWVRAHGYRSVRLVTADSHMPRAELEIAHALGKGVAVIGDGVATDPSFSTIALEYNKYLVRRAALALGIGA